MFSIVAPCTTLVTGVLVQPPQVKHETVSHAKDEEKNKWIVLVGRRTFYSLSNFKHILDVIAHCRSICEQMYANRFVTFESERPKHNNQIFAHNNDLQLRLIESAHRLVPNLCTYENVEKIFIFDTAQDTITLLNHNNKIQQIVVYAP